jgi:predicted outer membrane repeat protein
MTRNTMLQLAMLLALTPTAATDIINVPGDWPLIQQAIAFASNGDEIVVQQGNYFEHIDLMGKAITLRSTDPTDADVVYATRIVSIEPEPTVRCENGEDRDTVISGFRIMHLNPLTSNRGIYCNSTSPTVTYCIITDNLTAGSGGGMYSSFGNPLVEHCTFDGNSADGNGGAISFEKSTVEIANCTFRNNVAGINGGGVCCDNPEENSSVTDCSFSNNTALWGGGIGMGSFDGYCFEVTGCTFSHNAAASGGGFYSFAHDATLTNCAFVENSCTLTGGAIYNNGCDLTYVNTTFEGGSTDNPLLDTIGGNNWSHQTPPATPTGACCLGAAYCMVGTEAACLDAGGSYQGDGSNCDDLDCSCPGDINGDGARDQSDLGLLLASYEINDGGDLDGDGFTDQADLGLFLAFYEMPCP